jgi:hypothetical protein
MKIVVIGGTGLIGLEAVALLREKGHDAVAASPGTGVNAIAGACLEGAQRGAQLMIDVTNPPGHDREPSRPSFATPRAISSGRARCRRAAPCGAVDCRRGSDGGQYVFCGEVRAGKLGRAIGGRIRSCAPCSSSSSPAPSPI